MEEFVAIEDKNTRILSQTRARTKHGSLSRRRVVPSLQRGVRPPRIPLSYAQQRLWFVDRVQGGSTEYNIPEALRLKGHLDYEALRRTVATIVQRHESLRT